MGQVRLLLFGSCFIGRAFVASFISGWHGGLFLFVNPIGWDRVGQLFVVLFFPLRNQRSKFVAYSS